MQNQNKKSNPSVVDRIYLRAILVGVVGGLVWVCWGHGGSLLVLRQWWEYPESS